MVRGSKTGRPVMQALDVLGRRWSLRILWELREGARNFRTLREACDDVSPTSLSQRLTDLRELGVVDSTDSGYVLTDAGRELGDVLLALHRWAEEHAPKKRARK
jgi:DNA-binding HxlR family transcriptional regulator